MAANREKIAIENSNLFVEESGAPIEFYIPPGAAKARLRPLIEDSGGVVIGKVTGRDTIKLVDPSSVEHIISAGYTSTDFIYDCIKENKILDLEKYRLTRQLVTTKAGPSKSSSSAVVSSTTGRRRKFYTPEEDKAIFDYIKKSSHPPGGRKIWQIMEHDKVTTHSWRSMQSRWKDYLSKRRRVTNPETRIKGLLSITTAPSKGPLRVTRSHTKPEVESPKKSTNDNEDKKKDDNEQDVDSDDDGDASDDGDDDTEGKDDCNSDASYEPGISSATHDDLQSEDTTQDSTTAQDDDTEDDTTTQDNDTQDDTTTQDDYTTQDETTTQDDDTQDDDTQDEIINEFTSDDIGNDTLVPTTSPMKRTYPSDVDTDNDNTPSYSDGIIPNSARFAGKKRERGAHPLSTSDEDTQQEDLNDSKAIMDIADVMFRKFKDITDFQEKHNLTRPQVLHALYVSNGSLLDAYSYITTGYLRNDTEPWSPKEDNAILTQDKHGLAELYERRGRPVVLNRRAYLKGV